MIAAVHELRSRSESAATTEGIAAYLQVPEGEVREELRALRDNRIFDVRTRKGKRVWMPWREAH